MGRISYLPNNAQWISLIQKIYWSTLSSPQKHNEALEMTMGNNFPDIL